MKLTEKRIGDLAVEPGKRDRLVFDDEQAGLAVRVTANGSRSYLVQFTLAGQRQRLPLGNVRALSLAAARQAAAAAMGDVAKGQNPKAALQREAEAARVEKQRREITLGNLIESWSAKHLASQSLNYQREAVRALKHAFAGDLGRPAASLTKARVIAVLDDLPPTMSRRTANYGSALFAWAAGREMVPANPFDRVKVGSPTVQRDRVLTDEELRLIWHAAADMGRYGSIVRMLMITGQRREEVAGMSWSEVTGDIWTIAAKRTKNGVAHIVPLPAAAQTLIEAQPPTADLVFGKFSNWSRGKASLDAACGVSDWRIHDLRRTAATGLQRLGVRLEVVEAALNHVSGSKRGIVGIYQRHDWAAEKRAALSAWGAHLEQVISGEDATAGNVIALRA